MASTRTAIEYDKGPRGWIMAVVSFICAFILAVKLKALGVMIQDITDDLDSQLWIVGWIAVLNSAMQNLMGPMVTFMTGLVGYRATYITGGIVASLGFIMASLATADWQLVLCFVGLAGSGGACCWFVSMAVMSSYFKKKYMFAVSLSTLGFPMGILVSGPVTQVLLDTYGWRGTTLLFGGVSLHLIACGALVVRRPAAADSQYNECASADHQELEADEKTNSTAESTRLQTYCRRLYTSIDIGVMKNLDFWLLTGPRCCLSFCHTPWVVFMVSYGRLLGFGNTEVSFLATAFGFGEIVARLVFVIVSKCCPKVKPPLIASVSAASTSVFFIVCLLVQSYAEKLFCVCVIGVSTSVLFVSCDFMARFLTTDDRLVAILGWQAMFAGTGGILGGLLTGWIYEWTGSLDNMLYMYCAVMLLSFPMLIILYRRSPQVSGTDG